MPNARKGPYATNANRAEETKRCSCCGTKLPRSGLFHPCVHRVKHAPGNGYNPIYLRSAILQNVTGDHTLPRQSRKKTKIYAVLYTPFLITCIGWSSVAHYTMAEMPETIPLFPLSKPLGKKSVGQCSWIQFTMILFLFFSVSEGKTAVHPFLHFPLLASLSYVHGACDHFYLSLLQSNDIVKLYTHRIKISPYFVFASSPFKVLERSKLPIFLWNIRTNISMIGCSRTIIYSWIYIWVPKCVPHLLWELVNYSR